MTEGMFFAVDNTTQILTFRFYSNVRINLGQATFCWFLESFVESPAVN